MKHDQIEKSIPLMGFLTLAVISVGAAVEILPLFYIDSTIEKVEGMRPYTPLELKGRDIYLREGCYNCHSQMIRPFRDEFERYGHYSLAAESMYDHPFQWGSKRTGPDLARVGGRYSNLWHQEHMKDPRRVVPESVMPSYHWLATTPLDYGDIAKRLTALRMVGVPYTDEQIARAKEDLEAQAVPGSSTEELKKHYGAKVPLDDTTGFDGNAKVITELDAMISYLQMLGTLVDFSSPQAKTH